MWAQQEKIYMPCKIVAEVKFVGTTREGLHAKIVVRVEFVSTIRKDQNARIVAEVKLLSTTRKDQHAPHAIPLDTLPGSYEAVFILP